MTPSRKVHPLLVAVAGGDVRAFEELYRLSSPKLYGLVLRVLRQQELAGSAMRRAFARIGAEAGSASPREDPLAFLVARARAATLDMARARPGLDAWDPFEVEAPAADPLALPGRSPALTRLLACLGTLPEERRRMLLLAYYDGWGEEAISVVFDASAAVVRTMIARCTDQIDEGIAGPKPGPKPGLADADRHLPAEYALGTLPAPERAVLASRFESHPELAAMVRRWERRLAPLHELAAPVAPPPGLGRLIAADFAADLKAQRRSGGRGRNGKDTLARSGPGAQHGAQAQNAVPQQGPLAASAEVGATRVRSQPAADAAKGGGFLARMLGRGAARPPAAGRRGRPAWGGPPPAAGAPPVVSAGAIPLAPPVATSAPALRTAETARRLPAAGTMPALPPAPLPPPRPLVPLQPVMPATGPDPARARPSVPAGSGPVETRPPPAAPARGPLKPRPTSPPPLNPDARLAAFRALAEAIDLRIGNLPILEPGHAPAEDTAAGEPPPSAPAEAQVQAAGDGIRAACDILSNVAADAGPGPALRPEDLVGADGSARAQAQAAAGIGAACDVLPNAAADTGPAPAVHPQGLVGADGPARTVAQAAAGGRAAYDIFPNVAAAAGPAPALLPEDLAGIHAPARTVAEAAAGIGAAFDILANVAADAGPAPARRPEGLVGADAPARVQAQTSSATRSALPGGPEVVAADPPVCGLSPVDAAAEPAAAVGGPAAASLPIPGHDAVAWAVVREPAGAPVAAIPTADLDARPAPASTRALQTDLEILNAVASVPDLAGALGAALSMPKQAPVAAPSGGAAEVPATSLIDPDATADPRPPLGTVRHIEVVAAAAVADTPLGAPDSGLSDFAAEAPGAAPRPWEGAISHSDLAAVPASAGRMPVGRAFASPAPHAWRAEDSLPFEGAVPDTDLAAAPAVVGGMPLGQPVAAPSGFAAEMPFESPSLSLQPAEGLRQIEGSVPDTGLPAAPVVAGGIPAGAPVPAPSGFAAEVPFASPARPPRPVESSRPFEGSVPDTGLPAAPSVADGTPAGTPVAARSGFAAEVPDETPRHPASAGEMPSPEEPLPWAETAGAPVPAVESAAGTRTSGLSATPLAQDAVRGDGASPAAGRARAVFPAEPAVSAPALPAEASAPEMDGAAAGPSSSNAGGPDAAADPSPAPGADVTRRLPPSVERGSVVPAKPQPVQAASEAESTHGPVPALVGDPDAAAPAPPAPDAEAPLGPAPAVDRAGGAPQGPQPAQAAMAADLSPSLPPPVFRTPFSDDPPPRPVPPGVRLARAVRERVGPRAVAACLAVALAGLAIAFAYRELTAPRSGPWMSLLQAEPAPAVAVRLDPSTGFLKVRILAPPPPAGTRHALWLVTPNGGSHLLVRFVGQVDMTSAVLRRMDRAALAASTLEVTLEAAEATAGGVASAPEVVYRGRLIAD